MVMSSFSINFESFGARTQNLWLENKSETKVWQNTTNSTSVSRNHPLSEF